MSDLREELARLLHSMRHESAHEQASRLLPFVQAQVEVARNEEHNELSEYVHGELDKYGVLREDNEGILPEGTRIKRAIAAAVAAERERCAKIAHGSGGDSVRISIAAAIREGEKP